MSLLPQYHCGACWYQSVLLLELLLRIYGAEAGNKMLSHCGGRLADGGDCDSEQIGGTGNGYAKTETAPYDEISRQKSGAPVGTDAGAVNVRF